MSIDSHDPSTTKNSLKVSVLKERFNNMMVYENDSEKKNNSFPQINRIKANEPFLKIREENNRKSRSKSNDNVNLNEIKISIKNDDELIKTNYDISLIHSNNKEISDSTQSTNAIASSTEEQNINNNSQNSKEDTVLQDTTTNQISSKESDISHIENFKENSSSCLNEETSSNLKDEPVLENETDSSSLIVNSTQQFNQSFVHECPTEENGEETWLKKGYKKLMTFVKATDNQNRNLILRGIELFGDSFVNILLWKSDNDRNFWLNMAQNHISSFSQLTSELKLDLEIIINEIQEANRLNRVQSC